MLNWLNKLSYQFALVTCKSLKFRMPLIPVWTWSPICSSDIVTDIPFLTITFAEDGKQLLLSDEYCCKTLFSAFKFSGWIRKYFLQVMLCVVYNKCQQIVPLSQSA